MLGNRRFESISLHQRVMCEPHSSIRAPNISSLTGRAGRDGGIGRNTAESWEFVAELACLESRQPPRPGKFRRGVIPAQFRQGVVAPTDWADAEALGIAL
jgi:hypothetical protein